MLDQLRIQCPSCGIILDVRNSKHEALKQIVCPNCKKQLAVNFKEELEPLAPPQPIEPLYYGEMRIDLKEGVNKIALPDTDTVEIKVVRLKDGYTKCMVHPLGDKIPVKVNRQRLEADEQVVLSKGDYLEIGKTCLRTGEPGSLTPPNQDDSDDQGCERPAKPRPQKERNYIWLYAVLAFGLLMGATIYLWPSEQGKEILPPEDLAPHVSDSMVENPPVDTVDKARGKESIQKVTSPTQQKPPVEINKDLSDYDLEKLALKGDVDAQYKLGNRLIHGDNPSSILRGVKYLRMAAQNGSSKAKVVLEKVIIKLRQKATEGDSIAYYILKSI